MVRGSCNRFMPPHRAGSVLAALAGAKPAFRRSTAANLCRFGFRAGILVDESVILEIKAKPALLPAHGMPLQTWLRMSGLPVGCYQTSTRFVRKAAGGASSYNQTLFLLRGAQWPSFCLRVEESLA